MSDGVAIHRLDALDPSDVEAVRALVAEAAARDGFSALNQVAMINLSDPAARAVHLLAVTSDGLTGYAQLDSSAGSSIGSLVVAPDHRWTGIGDALLTRMIGSADHRLQIWAPHHTAAAEALADRHRLEPVRKLLIMGRALDGRWSAAALPAGITLRPFVPGQDETAWLAANARAFAHHPEQGRLGRHDLDRLLAEPWFDASGFLLAIRDDDAGLVGFHWTKQHPGTLGEVYVLGVDPATGLRGLGRPLLLAGLDHLRRIGDTEVILYVESDNAAARRLYDTTGFRVINTDVLYATATTNPRD